MLRLRGEADDQDISGLHDPEYAESAHSLHRVGQELSVEVSDMRRITTSSILTEDSEVFGVSEDQAAFDHSGDADNGKYTPAPTKASLITSLAQEIGELKKESEALKQIRDATGKPEFPKLLFEKVFNTDVVRLRSVEDMWKSRKAPEPVEYDTLMGKSSSLTEQSDAIIRDGQKVWSLEESLIVFNDSLDRLSKRILQMRKDKDPSAAEPTIAFDKDDEDTLDFVVSSANIRSSVFGIDRKSRFETKQMAGNIIPAIATTNAIVAGVCILQAYKVLRGDIMQAKEVRLRSTGVLALTNSIRSFCSHSVPVGSWRQIKRSGARSRTAQCAVSTTRALL